MRLLPLSSRQSTGALLTLAALVSCAGGGQKASLCPQDLPAALVNHGSFSLVAQPRIVVARDQASWEELWDLQGSASQRPGPLPDLNLRKEMAIGVFLGQRPSPGYDLEWISCEDRDGVTHLLVRELDTDPHRLLPLAVTYPYRIFRVPRTEGPVQVQFD